MKNSFSVIVNGYPALVEWLRFPGGEHHVRIKNPTTVAEKCNIEVEAKIQDGEIMQLALLKDAIDRAVPNSDITLRLKYVPYARQDRVAVDGESLSIKVFCNLVNTLGFSCVWIVDPHSIVTEACLNNVYVCSQDFAFMQTVKMYNATNKWDAIVSPDAGAEKKARKIAEFLNKPLIVCTKKRDPVTGVLSSPKIVDKPDAVCNNVVIVDDICDGGYTFVQLAKVLKESDVKSVDLYVTHGIFSKGTDLEGIDNIYCYNKFD